MLGEGLTEESKGNFVAGGGNGIKEDEQTT